MLFHPLDISAKLQHNAELVAYPNLVFLNWIFMFTLLVISSVFKSQLP